ncbi:MAG: inositol monophosphatase family protein, partial [Verrucomicrobiota bacterium]
MIHVADEAEAAARRAGQMIEERRGGALTIETKAEGLSRASSVVTEVDRDAQALILEHLQPSREAFDLALLTEENEDDGSRFEKACFWCIDPLDGTLPFVEDKPGYSVAIALVSRTGTPLIGIIFDPRTRRLYRAVQGGGATRNGEPWQLETPGASKPLTFFADRSFAEDPCRGPILAGLEAMDYAGLRTPFPGGASLNACWALEQAPGCYVKRPRSKPGGGSLWDFSASACIVGEAGGVASDIYGHPLDLNRADSTFMNHRGVLFASDPRLAE